MHTEEAERNDLRIPMPTFREVKRLSFAQSHTLQGTAGNEQNNGVASSERTEKEKFAEVLEKWLGSTTEEQRAKDGGRFLIGHTNASASDNQNRRSS